MNTQIIILFILTSINAFFASTEIAFISLNDMKIEKLVQQGNKKAKDIKMMMDQPSKFLATIQIGITLAGFLSSAFAAEAFADELAPFLYSSTNIFNLTIWGNISIFIVTIILSFFTLVFGELVPKRIAMKNYEKIAFRNINIIKTISYVTAPFVNLLTLSTNLISKIFGVVDSDEAPITEEEIRMMVDIGKEKGTVNNEEKEMITNVFEFNDKVVSEIMIHRKDILAFNLLDSTEEVLEKIEEYKYSRIPVYSENIDNIVGVLYLKDVFVNIKNNEPITLSNLIKEPYYVSENKIISELFYELKKSKIHMAIVVDEYGGTAGIVTLENIIEELVGNIFDEHDDIEKEYEKIDDNTYIFDGNIDIDEFEKVLEIKIPSGEYNTLSGYLIEILNRIPSKDEKIELEIDGLIYNILEIDKNILIKIKVTKI